jgi:hypothetical protein
MLDRIAMYNVEKNPGRGYGNEDHIQSQNLVGKPYR